MSCSKEEHVAPKQAPARGTRSGARVMAVAIVTPAHQHAPPETPAAESAARIADAGRALTAQLTAPLVNTPTRLGDAVTTVVVNTHTADGVEGVAVAIGDDASPCTRRQAAEAAADEGQGTALFAGSDDDAENAAESVPVAPAVAAVPVPVPAALATVGADVAAALLAKAAASGCAMITTGAPAAKSAVAAKSDPYAQLSAQVKSCMHRVEVVCGGVSPSDPCSLIVSPRAKPLKFTSVKAATAAAIDAIRRRAEQMAPDEVLELVLDCNAPSVVYTGGPTILLVVVAVGATVKTVGGAAIFGAEEVLGLAALTAATPAAMPNLAWSAVDRSPRHFAITAPPVEYTHGVLVRLAATTGPYRGPVTLWLKPATLQGEWTQLAAGQVIELKNYVFFFKLWGRGATPDRWALEIKNFAAFEKIVLI